MSEKNFVINGSINVDGVTIDLTGTTTGSSLHRVGNTVTAKQETPIGTVVMFAGSVGAATGYTGIPAGWFLCDGRAINRTTYASLFAVIGTAYNIGGEAGTDFRLPNMVDNFAIGHIQFSGGSGVPATVSSTTDTTTLSSHSHNASYSSSPWGSGAAAYANHTHGVVADGGHAHITGANTDIGDNSTSYNPHNLGSDGISHRHSYLRGNSTSGSMAFSDSNHTHTLNGTDSAHNHGSNGVSVGHNHGSTVANITRHQHTMTIPQTDNNQANSSSTHTHSTGFTTSKVFFIIKYEHGV
jgi:microcystin-dependent protein